MNRGKRFYKKLAALLLVIMIAECVVPGVSYALTTGPTQPEVQDFEPIGTTDMVDMFSGDFNYNIPLLDVEGYPVNICYHGGVTMEQEASWVGLGWNINPGVVNRTMRGIPDDFDGDSVRKELHIKDETNLRVGLGVGIEVFGKGDPKMSGNASFGVSVNMNNYRGVSCDLNLGAGVNLFKHFSLGVNYGVGSQSGADIDYNLGVSGTSAARTILEKEMVASGSLSCEAGYNTRSGIKDLNFGASMSAAKQGTRIGANLASASYIVPISLKNYVPVVTNSSTMSSIYGRIKVGGEMTWCLFYGNINGMYNKIHYNNDGSRRSYGYLYLDHGDEKSILDFTRDKDGLFNENMQFLPMANMTYDVYSLSGQGTGGTFRPYRNDFGSVGDPATDSRQESNSLSLEVGLPPNLFELGADYCHSGTSATSGQWLKYKRPFTGRSDGSIYESVYLKEGGEKNAVNQTYVDQIGGKNAITPDDAHDLPSTKPGAMQARDPRGNLLFYHTAGEASEPIYDYQDDLFEGGASPTKVSIPRVSDTRRNGQISEMVQVQKDGRRFIYGIPAMNNTEKEATFSVDAPNGTNLAQGLAPYSSGTDDAVTNSKGRDNYYSSTTTPSYAHSYLLTSILSTDFVDVTGNGVSDDDLGTYTKFNYSRKEADYKWKAPFDNGKAQYNSGFLSDLGDDKGSYVSGSREQWYLHSIETKNFIAEFYTSQREDAKAVNGASSYKLDSLKLYNKHDRFINGASAIPIKTVFFVYDYSLCPGIPNGGSGKLTLKKIYFRYGYSKKSLMSPYQFEYGFNPNYNLANKDRWGNYKQSISSWNNYEFPFVDQNDPANDTYASAWSLVQIQLPSGGIIQTEYESDDYAFVQNKPTMEMVMIKGIGAGPQYVPGTQLYWDKNSPLLYAYFDRSLSREDPHVSFEQNYLTDRSAVYYNFNVKIAGKQKTHEQIKGYAAVEKVGACSDGIHGYIKFQAVTAKGGGAELNPVCYTALNVGRYNLPQIVFPGSDPDESDLTNVLLGLKEAFVELVSATRNPLIRFLVKNMAQEVNLQKSYVRLLTPGYNKKGGGQRVKRLLFFDSWNTIAGGDEPQATYGKIYQYKLFAGQSMSSGVASYEPLIGGDENPFRTPVPYAVTSGSSFPPNDPVELYQEMPIGESLYPPGTVGYSNVTVTNLRGDIGRSTQEQDVYTFYTARDYPVKCYSSAINKDLDRHWSLFRQSNTLEATQGFSLVLNDMHGKPRSIEHYAINKRSGTLTKVSSQVYSYKHSGDELDNVVNCLSYKDGAGIVAGPRRIGEETDITIDTRQKKEFTTNFTLNANLNVSAILFAVIPIPLAYPWYGEYKNEFSSATVTKVTQQYGVVDKVFIENEGAKTTISNEFFDAETGEVLVSSVNNEFGDKEFTTNIPASWCYLGMAPAYSNTNYQLSAPTMTIDSELFGNVIVDRNVCVGDQLSVSYQSASGARYSTTAWLMSGGSRWDTIAMVQDSITNGLIPILAERCVGKILPRYPGNTPGWSSGTTVNHVTLKVVKSGHQNILNENIESFTTLGMQGLYGYLNSSKFVAINARGQTFCDSNTMVQSRFIVNPDTINPYAIGERGIYRKLSDYAYVTDRRYSGSSRDAGLFVALPLFSAYYDNSCVSFPYRYLAPSSNPNWRVGRTITKWSPNGKEVENVNAIGIYSSAVYRYNHELPVAVATNANQHDIFNEAFEDYSLLKPITNLTGAVYSPFDIYFSSASFSPPLYSLVNLTGSSLSIVNTEAHSGKYSIYVAAATPGVSGAFENDLPLFNNYSLTNNKYNTYFRSGIPVTPRNEYLSFSLTKGRKYLLSFWIKQRNPAPNLTTYSYSSSCGIRLGSSIVAVKPRSNIIEGWQQVEATFTVPTSITEAKLNLPLGYCVDDIRILPFDANMKSFVYDPKNEKLVATLDENNFATFYEYDQEGLLIRTKKETERGVITMSESRRSNHAQ